MTAAVGLLLVVAAVAHAGWNLTLKGARIGPGRASARFLWLTFVAGAIVFAPLGVTSLAQAGLGGSETARLLAVAAVSGALQVGYFLLLQRAYRAADVSVVYPVARGAGPLLSVVLAVAVLGERPHPLALLGAVVVIAGVVAIGAAGGRHAPGRTRAGIGFGMLVGVGIAAYTLWDAWAVTALGMPPVGYYWVSLLVQVVLFAVAAVPHPRPLLDTAREHWGAVLIVGLLSPLAYVLVLFAYQLAPVSLVAPAREASVVLVALGAWMLFREPHPVPRLVGSAVVLAGITLLAVA